MSAANYVTYFMLLSWIGIIAAALAGLRVAISQTDWKQSQRGLRTVTVLLPLWFAAAVALSYAGAFRGTSSTLPTIEFGIFVPIVVGVVWLWRSKTGMQLLDAVSQSWLVGLQFYRVLGAIFLVMYAQGRMPAAFALSAGAGDVAVGLLAPIVAVAYTRGVAGRELLLVGWNLLGLLDLTNAIITGFLTSPSPLQVLALDAPNQLIGEFPMVLVPVFGVPLGIILHVASLIKLGRDAARRPALNGV